MVEGLPTCNEHGLAYNPAVSTGCVLCRKSARATKAARTSWFVRWWPALTLSTFALVCVAAIAVNVPAVRSAPAPSGANETEPADYHALPSPRLPAALSPENQAEAERARFAVAIEALLDQLRPQVVACVEGADSACLGAASRCADLMKHLGLPAQKATTIASPPRRRLYDPDIDSTWARLCGANGAAPYEKSCELANHESCKKACDLGSPRGCLSFAAQQSDPIGAERYRERANVLGECERQGISPCVLPPAQPIRTINTAEEQSVLKAEAECQQGAGPTCLRLAQRYEAGEGVPQDLRRAVELRQKACETPPYACLDLAKMYTFGTGVAKDEQHALSLVAKHYSDFDRAAKECGHAQTLECLFAHMGSSAALRPEYLARFAPQTYERECRSGDFHACKGVEELYRNGVHGFMKDVARADELAALASAASSRRQGTGH